MEIVPPGAMSQQGIPDYTGTETFANYYGSYSWHLFGTIKKVQLYICDSLFAVLVLCCRTTRCWVLFANIDVFFLLTSIDHSNIYKRLANACLVKTATGFWCLYSNSEKASLSSVFFVYYRLTYFSAWQLIVQARM